MPRDTGLGHDSNTYLIDGVELPSVTHVIKTVMNGAFTAAAWWGYKMGVEAAGGDLDRAKKVRNPNSSRDAGSSRGQSAHDVLERLMKGEDVAVDSLKNGYEIAVWSWVQNQDGQKILGVEEKVYSLGMGFAGTLDLVREGDLGIEVVDLKTHKGKPRFEDSLQIAAYGAAYNEMHGLGGQPKSRVVVAHEGGTYEESTKEVDPRLFLEMLRIYKALKEYG